VPSKPTLTVAGLIEQLAKHDPSLPVWADGCDCANRVIDLEANDEDQLRLIVDTVPENFPHDDD
jgi:hypothetical protein